METAAGHTGAMVAFFIGSEMAQKMAIPGGEPAGDLHLTLVYLGESAAMQEQRPRIEEALKTFVESHAPISGTIGGLARFIGVGDNGEDAFVALFDSPELPAWRQQLVEALGVDMSEQTHGFIPHITLAYIPGNAPMPAWEHYDEMTLSTVSLAWGDGRVEYNLRTQEVYANLPQSQWGKMDRCVKDVMKQGKDKQGAIAICYTSIHEARESWREAQPADLKPHGPDFDGSTWEVTLIGAKSPDEVVMIDGEEFVQSLNRRLYSCAGLEESVPRWDGCQVYDNHLTDEEFADRAGMRSMVKELVGVITDPWWDAQERKLKGVLKVGDRGIADKLKNFWDLGVVDKIGGLSIDTIPDNEQEVLYNGQRYKKSRGFQRIFSADLVARPGAGGGIDRLVESELITTIRKREGFQMDEMQLKQLQELLGQTAANLAAAAQMLSPNGGEGPGMEACAPGKDKQPGMESQESATQATAPTTATAPVQTPAAAAPSAQESLESRLHQMECQLMLRDALEASGLDAAQRRVVEAAFTGRVFKKPELDGVIARSKEAQAAHDPTGRPAGAGQQRGVDTRGALAPIDKAQMDLLRLMVGSERLRAIEAIDKDYVSGRRPESWNAWVNAGRPNYGTRRLSDLVYNLLGGDPMVDNRALEAIMSSGLSSITKNALNLILAADYSVRDEWWNKIVTVDEFDTPDEATLVRVYGLSILNEVDEGQTYLPLIMKDDEETAQFVKNGNYVGVTIEAMMRDKLSVIRNIPRKLADSWYNTLSARVAAVFTTNSNTGPVLSDTGALFNATAVGTPGGHANLLTTALSFAAFKAARTAMLKQTDQPLGAGRRLMIEPRYILVPADLETTALQIRNSEKEPGVTDNSINPFFQKFDVVKVPEWTDTNDWSLVADPAIFPAIWQLFLRGNRVPMLVSAGSEDGGAMFTNDEMRWKVRQMSYRFSSTYNCAPVSDFRPLHKSNV
jgi:2'-5' RNA ligase